MRYLHSNGASFFFVAVYIHIFRGLYYGSYKAPRELLWILGCIIYLLMMATGFMGYVLPWGQMSFWGATVITGFFSAIPLVGDWIQQLLLGGFAVDNPTLNRFFALHYLLPFMIAGVVVLHVWALHVVGQSNPTGIEVKSKTDTVAFTPYATIKDAFGMIVFLFFFAYFVFYLPNYLGHPDNYTVANPLKTPAHIVPEWYFLPFYAILRAITFNIGPINSKLGGVLCMFGAIVMLFLVPWLDTSKVRSAVYRPWYKLFFWLFVADAVLLGWLGSQPAEGSYVFMAQMATLVYFAFFLVALPVLGLIETPRRLPNSITEAVLEKNKVRRRTSGGCHGRAEPRAEHDPEVGRFSDAGQSGRESKGIWHEEDSHLAGAAWPCGRRHWGLSTGAIAAEEAHNAAAPTHFPIDEPKEMDWSFTGPFGTYDKAPAAARPEGLQGSLLGLPFDEPGGVPHAGRPWLFGCADQDAGGRVHHP